MVTATADAAPVARAQPRVYAAQGKEPVPHRLGVPDAVERERLRSSVGAALRHARAEAGISQRRLAVLAGCDRRTVQRLEAGTMRPSTALVRALAHAITVPPGWAPAGRRAHTAALLAELETAADTSLVLASGRRARWRRRRHRAAARAASKVALPSLRASAAGGGQVQTLLRHAALLVQAADRELS